MLLLLGVDLVVLETLETKTVVAVVVVLENLNQIVQGHRQQVH